MRHASTAACLAIATALSFTPASQAQTVDELKSQLESLKAELAELKKDESCSTQAFQATANERYRYTYIGRLVVPAGSVDSRISRITNALSANEELRIGTNGVTLQSETGSLVTRTQPGSIRVNLNALSAANGHNATVSLPLSSFLGSNGNLSDVSDSQRAILSVDTATLRGGARRLSAIERGSALNHQIVTDGNFVSGIYRGTKFIAAPSAANPFVGR